MINNNFGLFVQNITMKIAFNGNNPKNQKFFSLTPAEKLIWILKNEIKELLCLLGISFLKMVTEPMYKYICYHIHACIWTFDTSLVLSVNIEPEYKVAWLYL